MREASPSDLKLDFNWLKAAHYGRRWLETMASKFFLHMKRLLLEIIRALPMAAYSGREQQSCIPKHGIRFLMPMVWHHLTQANEPQHCRPFGHELLRLDNCLWGLLAVPVHF